MAQFMVWNFPMTLIITKPSAEVISSAPVRRYAVFAGERYYASGGLNDLVDSFSSRELAEAFAESLLGERIDRRGYNETIEWWHVADLETATIVAKSETDPY